MNGGTPIARAARDCERRAGPRRLPGRPAGRGARPGPAFRDRLRRGHHVPPGQPRVAGVAAPPGAGRARRSASAVWAFMYLRRCCRSRSAAPTRLPAVPQLLNQLGIHALGVGLPIAWFAAARRAPRIGSIVMSHNRIFLLGHCIAKLKTVVCRCVRFAVALTVVLATEDAPTRRKAMKQATRALWPWPWHSPAAARRLPRAAAPAAPARFRAASPTRRARCCPA